MVRLERVSKTIHKPGQAPRTLLRDVSLWVPRGCLYGVMGPGAAGKSVLLKVVTGLMRPDEGIVRIGDDVLTEASELRIQEIRQRIGMLFQNSALFQHLSVFENVAFPLRRLYALPEAEVRERVRERLACVSLAGYGDRLPDQLSGGQKKRVGVARATVTDRVGMMYRGELIFDGTTDEARSSGEPRVKQFVNGLTEGPL